MQFRMKTYENERIQKNWGLNDRFRLQIMVISKGDKKEWIKVNYNEKHLSRMEKNQKPRETKKYHCVHGKCSMQCISC